MAGGEQLRGSSSTARSPDSRAPSEDPDIRDLAAMMMALHRIVVFTGAGISAESGIPTYRGAGGMWTKYDPEKYASIDYFRQDPSYYWRFYKEVRQGLIASAKPGMAHHIIAAMEKAGQISAVITQNIDGLHQKAGSVRVLELHGNTTRFYCFECHVPYSMADVARQLETAEIPVCAACGGVLRPDVVLFGETLPPIVVAQAEQEAQMSDLMIVIGSSLVVYPAAGLPYQAKHSGAHLAIINIDPTPLDDLADLCIHRPAGEVLPQAVALALRIAP